SSTPLRILDRRSCSREIASTESLCRNLLKTRKDLPAPATFICHKEETPIVCQRSTCCRAELITLKWGFWGRFFFIEKVTSIQLVVSQKFPRRSEERRVGKECRYGRRRWH